MEEWSDKSLLSNTSSVGWLASEFTPPISLRSDPTLKIPGLTLTLTLILRASQVALVVKNPPANAGDAGGTSLTPGSGRVPRGGHGNPLQYSCLENPRDREVWWATVPGVEKNQARLKWLRMHACIILWDLLVSLHDQGQGDKVLTTIWYWFTYSKTKFSFMYF